MTTGVLMLFAGMVIGAVARSELAQPESDRWHALCDSLRARCERLAAERDYWRAVAHSGGVRQPAAPLGGDVWLLGALEAVHGEVRPGERAESIGITVRWKATSYTALIRISRGAAEPERAVMLHVTDGENCWQVPEDVDLPPADSPDWITGLCLGTAKRGRDGCLLPRCRRFG